MKNFDVLVVGGGPGGYTTALRMAEMGKSVVLFEKKKIGGACLHVGCIPTKLLQSAASRYHALVKEGKSWGIEAQGVSFNFQTLVERSQKTISILERGIVSRLASAKVEVVQGTATVKDPDLVECGGEEYQAPLLILAVGSRPRHLPSFPIGGNIVTSDELLSQPRLPKSILIIGAGVIGLEFACLYAQLGVKVRVGDIIPKTIPTMDQELAQVLMNSLQKLGIEMEMGVPEVKARDEELILVAAGRVPNIDQAGIPSLGLRTQGGKIMTDEYLQTSAQGVIAIGDLTGKFPYAHTAYEHARIVAHNQTIGSRPERMDDTKVPHVVFTSPEMASVGLTEVEAQAKGLDVKVRKNNFAANSKARILGEIQGWSKTLTDAKSGEILGIHLAGPEATDLIGEACVLVSRKVTMDQLERVIHPHPTLSEIFGAH